MGRSQRDKGRRGEQEVARILRAAGFDVDRVPNSGGLRVKGDITGLAGFHLEVKRQERTAIWEWLEQAAEEADGPDVPLLIFRRSHSDWHVALPFDAFVEMLAERRSLKARLAALLPVIESAVLELGSGARPRDVADMLSGILARVGGEK